jgi:hypothetical protein
VLQAILAPVNLEQVERMNPKPLRFSVVVVAPMPLKRSVAVVLKIPTPPMISVEVVPSKSLMYSKVVVVDWGTMEEAQTI